jgi:hypothetical protein
MDWKNNFKVDGYKLLYKGVDLGLTMETIQDLRINAGIEIDEKFVENLYNSQISVIRDKKLDIILKK